MNLGLMVCHSHLMIVSAFNDADWAGCLDDWRSIIGLRFFLVVTSFQGVPGSKVLSHDQA